MHMGYRYNEKARESKKKNTPEHAMLFWVSPVYGVSFLLVMFAAYACAVITEKSMYR